MGYTGRRPLYGLDIETDTSDDGLDPGVARVVAVAVSSEAGGDVVLTGSEGGVLAALDAHLGDLEPGVVVTWNGGAFDLPFLAARAAVVGVPLGLELAWDPAAYRLGRAPLPGSLGVYAACWYGHGHLDAYRAWRAVGLASTDEPCGLKAVARTEGLDAVEVSDISQLHAVPVGELRRYVASDAALARQLAEHHWSQLRRCVDRLPPGGQLALG
ncbi:MAG TPA: 3'-5' exonuclease [Acidimicrobiales bacterium]|nr:3'-5' exonuclease [Acidimicrobiales bacterium]